MPYVSTMKLPNTLTLAGTDGHNDDIDLYLAAMSSHDGTTAWRDLVVLLVWAVAGTALTARTFRWE